MKGKNYRIGSIWRRWDPHLHVPGTLFNDRYREGEDGWHEFLNKLECATPIVSAIGITDYYNLEGYAKVVNFKENGRLPKVDLIFPNIELRLNIGASKGPGINIHLLVSPEDEEHIVQTHRFLRELSFVAFNETFRCEGDDLKRLGRIYSKAEGKSQTDDRLLLIEGCHQFKIDFNELRKAWQASEWIRANALIAVAGGTNDGTSMLGNDSSQKTLRAEIEKFSHIIFSSQPKQRTFWLGKTSSRGDIESRYGGRKPCLHGSDAHQLEKVAQPALNRFCWIKGDSTFEALKQACIEPTRAYVGELPLEDVIPSQTISTVSVSNALWINPSKIQLNPGLVCIIGARGSGKTALADMIAAGASATASRFNNQSFLDRATNFLKNSESSLNWCDGDTTSCNLGSIDIRDGWNEVKVQYLSQKFVEQLCGADGLTTDLLGEIERVIFQAHPVDDRFGSTDFREMLERRISRSRTRREDCETQLSELSEKLSSEQEKRASLPTLEKQRQEAFKRIQRVENDRKRISLQGSQDRLAELDQVTKAVDTVSVKIDSLKQQQQALEHLKDKAERFTSVAAPKYVSELKSQFGASKLNEEEWSLFTPRFSGDVDDLLESQITVVERELECLKGLPLGLNTAHETYLKDQVSFADHPLNILKAEQKRLQDLIGIDQNKKRQFAQLASSISEEQTKLNRLDKSIELSKEADDNIQRIKDTRNSLYKEIFDALAEEEEKLLSLYQPLRNRLSEERGALSKLTFFVSRTADIISWAKTGESLLDLRKSGAFRGHGALIDLAQKDLQKVWEEGSSNDVAKALSDFLDEHGKGIMEQSPVERRNIDAFQTWKCQVSNWLYDTKHIHLKYKIKYDGVEVEQLSPGTRGIVLLLLYLTIDREDQRPLIIDQPEENLDPKSIFDELVDRFLEAKSRRQIIVVTHNANLVVNTDADQVIVASSTPQQPGALPKITYESGGLENTNIRRQVCEILEGGEAAFRNRARRLRLRAVSQE